MPTGLIRRGARYSIRRRIPADVRHHYSQKSDEIVRALDTENPKEARKRLPLAWAALDREFDGFRSQVSTSLPTAPVAASPPAAPTRTKHAWAAMSEERWNYEMEALAFRDAETSRLEFEREERAELEAAILATLDAPLDNLSPEQRALRDIVKDRDFARDVAREQEGLVRSRVAVAERAPKMQPVLDTKPRAPADEPSTSFDTLVDMWALERKVDAKGVQTHRAVARWFEERVGTLPVEKITKRDIIAFKAKLIAEGATLPNVKVKLSRLRTLLNFAVGNAIIAENPAKDVPVHLTDADRNKRKPFDLPRLTAIFTSPVYAADVRPKQGRGEAAYWLPLLALYTGARLEELGQLRPSDVREEAYLDGHDQERKAWFIYVMEDEEDGLKVKNAGSERVIPVHPVLEEIGFIRFAQAAASAGQARIFSDLRANVFGRLTAKWGEWFGSYKRTVVGIGDRRYVFHSFRHTFKHFARHVGMIEGVQRQIMGHSPGDVPGDYGDGYTHHQLVEGMRLYRVPGFKPPSPPPEFRG